MKNASWILLYCACASPKTASSPTQTQSSRSLASDKNAATVGTTDCANPAHSTNVCDYTPPAEGNTQIVVHADIIGESTLWQGGEVAYDTSTGEITCAGCDCETSGAAKLECGAVVVSPGLINSHDHITYANLQPEPVSSERYDCRDEWRLGLDGHTKISDSGDSDSTASIQLAEVRFMMSGATSTIGSGGAPHFLRNLDTNSQSEQEGLTVPPVQYETFPLEDNGTLLTGSCKYPNDYAPAANGGPWYPHVSEGVNAASENEFACLSSTNNGGRQMINSNVSVMHGIGLTLADAETMQATGASLVWAPRSNIVLYGDTADVTLYQTLGVNIALGTDWIISGSMNMAREFACVDALNQQHYNGFFSDQQIVDMATINGAKAAHADSEIGSLSVGKFADLAFFSEATNTGYRAVIAAQPQDVMLVTRAAKPLYGDATLLASLGDTGCEALSVCGANKSICIESEANETLATLQSAAKHEYGLFYCGTPDNEPSCVPARDQKNDGSIYSGVDGTGDADGDGVADASDNCPNIFNPPRPMDMNAQSALLQPDGDGDGIGDACDPCPFDASNACD